MIQLKLWLFNIREFIVKNYFVSIKALYYDNKDLFYFNNYFYILQFILGFLPFQLVSSWLEYFNIDVIYKLDSIYNITNIKKTHILPIILNFEFTLDNNKNNFSSNIKYYNASIPFKFLLDTNKLNNYDKLHIKYMSKGRMYDKVVDIPLYKQVLLYELFQDK